MSLTILVVRSKINGRWTYCPASSRQLLRPEQQEDAPFPTCLSALAAIRRDKTIPKDADVVIETAPGNYP